MARSALAITFAAVATAATVAIASTGCDGGASEQPDQPPGGRVPVGTGYTSDQLEQALLTAIPGYRRAAEPDSGEYGSLREIQNLTRLQRQVKLDKPQCSGATHALDTTPDVQDTAAAITTFAKGLGQYATEALMTVPDEIAERLVGARVPAGCRSFRTRVGDQWATHRVVEATRGRLGQGSRTVGVATVSGSSRVKTWYVVLRSHSYVATITLYGPNVTASEAEQLARQAYEQAERTLS